MLTQHVNSAIRDHLHAWRLVPDRAVQSVGDWSAIIHASPFLWPVLAGIKRFEEHSGADSYFDGQV